MSRSCVCGGSNENCRYCNGLGTINDGLADALTTHAQRIEAGRVTDDFLPMHGRRLSPRQPRQALIRCAVPGCSVMLNPTKVSKHVTKMHSANRPVLSPEPTIPKISPVKLPPKPIPCPVSGCSAKLNPNRVARHMLKAHRGVLQARVNKSATHIANEKTHTGKAAREIVVNSIPDGTPRVSSYAQAPEKNLDATKGYAHAYRENGRFGSHPSHDGFDGEAGPD